MNIEATDKVIKKTIRKSNFELLRIVSILLIIPFHYCGHGNGGIILKSDISINQTLAFIFGSWGLLGVDCFIFISAYFLIDSSKFSSKKLLRLILQTIFYSACITILLHLFGFVKLNKTDLIKSAFSPLFPQIYWFATAYCMLYIVSPFLNKIIHSMNSRYLFKFLIILTLLISIYKTIISGAPIDDFIFVIYLYLIMGYLKQNDKNWFEVHARKGFFITTMCIILFNAGMSFLGTLLKLQVLQNNASILIERYSPVMILDTIFLFYIFKNLDIKSSKLINTIAKTTFGIYLFHENPVLGKILWDDILKINKVYYSPFFILYFFISILSLFVIGVLIDMLRIKLFEEPIFNIKINCIEIYLKKIDLFINQN